MFDLTLKQVAETIYLEDKNQRQGGELSRNALMHCWFWSFFFRDLLKVHFILSLSHTLYLSLSSLF